MDRESEKELRLAALCRRMGRMWSEDVIVRVHEKIPEEKLRECNLTLLGKLHSRPNVNFQAFLLTMKRAWKTENVVCEQMEPGLFSFTFSSDLEKRKVLEASPWSFSNNLLILQQLNPKLPIHCHEFTHCAFWMQVLGLPLIRITENALLEVASIMGKILEVKIEPKGGSLCKVGRVRVLMELSCPLKSGAVVNFEDDQFWVDFKYERLPHYCHSCGRIGHYTTSCEEVPYKEAGLEEIGDGNFGDWLKAEEHETSPFWKLFYGKECPMPEEEVLIPETPAQAGTLEDLAPTENDNPQGVRHGIIKLGESSEQKGKGLPDVGLTAKGKRTKGTPRLILDRAWTESLPKGPATSVNKSRKDQKTPVKSSQNGKRETPASRNGGGDQYRFPLAAVRKATNDFDESQVIGIGGFGKVYQGELNDGTRVAVKRGSPQSQQGLEEFQTEIQILSLFRHRHLVSLIGYCDEKDEMILIYEYMENGTLRSHLFGSGLPSLSWKQRLEICIGATKGLLYLHAGNEIAVIHRDVKSTNILLDENLVAKIADFGTCKGGLGIDQTHVSTVVKGTFGYLDPNYFRTSQVTQKSDVYAFGVVLLEVLCARPPIDVSLPEEKQNLAGWAMEMQKKGQLDQIVDPFLVGKIKPDSLREFGATVEKCLADRGIDRISMGDVLWRLEYALRLLLGKQIPKNNPALNRIPKTNVEKRAQKTCYTDQKADEFPTSYAFKDLKKMTGNFSEEIGRGAFGTVYKGTLMKNQHSSKAVAVKKIEKISSDGEREYLAEVKTLGKTRDRNLVRLLGYCHDGKNRLLMYEYMSNGSLADVLFKAEHQASWEVKMGIVQNVARGLLYLHEECEMQIIHCDIKPQNILIDDNMQAKISDFGLSKLLKPDQTNTMTGIRGTRGYLAPEWFRNLPVTVKVDTYSFGIVLLEIICGRRCVDVSLPEEEAVLEDWVYHCFQAGELDKLVHYQTIDQKQLERMVKVAFWCIQEEPALRPSMREVLLMLEGTVDIPIPPCLTSFPSVI